MQLLLEEELRGPALARIRRELRGREEVGVFAVFVVELVAEGEAPRRGFEEGLARKFQPR